MIKLTLLSMAFLMGSEIPPIYTCIDKDISPPLHWEQVPEGTVSLALICDDPDAPVGDWVHWVIFNIPASQTELKEDISPTAQLPSGAIQGLNDFGRHGYGGPCPPPGKSHRYYFKLYALDTMFELNPKASKRDVLTAMKGHILGQGELMGTFRR